MSEDKPTVITLDNNNSLQIVCQYIEIAQNKGAFQLAEAEILKRAIDVVINNVPDHEIDHVKATHLLVQGIIRGQSSGSYTLNDAALLHKVVTFISNSLTQQPTDVPPPQPTINEPPSPAPTRAKGKGKKAAVKPVVEEDFDLAEPIPLKPKEV
jgi:hypothetical protein